MQIRDISIYIVQILLNTLNFHLNNAVHRDIKLENFILSRKAKYFKLGDLGLSIFCDNKTEIHELAGTLKYLNK